MGNALAQRVPRAIKVTDIRLTQEELAYASMRDVCDQIEQRDCGCAGGDKSASYLDRPYNPINQNDILAD